MRGLGTGCLKRIHDRSVGRYLVDTSTLIDVSKRLEPMLYRLRLMVAGGDELGVCPIQVTEFFAGLSPAERNHWHGFMDTFHYWPISRGAAVRAGAYRYDFARQGLALSVNDALTAAVAREQYATVITDNAKHFPMGDVATLSLRG